MAAKPPIPHEIAVEMWRARLDERSISFIHEDHPEYSRRAIADLLSGEPPEELRNDPRLQPHSFIWIACYGLPAHKGHSPSFVVAKVPRKLAIDSFHKGLRTIRRTIVDAHKGADVDLTTVDALDAAQARRFAVDKNFPAFVIEADGNTRPLGADGFEPSPADTTGPDPSPSP